MRKGEGSPCNEGFVKGNVGGKVLPKEVNGSIEGSVSFVKESCVDLGGGDISASDGDDVAYVNNDSAENSGKGKRRQRKGQPLMEGR